MPRFFSAPGEISPVNMAWHRFVLAEGLGMLVFVYVCCAATAQVLVGEHDHSIMLRHFWGDYSAIALGCGLGLTIAFVLAGNVFHPHLNPAVSFTLVLLGDIPAKLLPSFWLAQFVGALLGAGFAVAIHNEKLLALPDELGRRAFASYPALEDFNQATVLWDVYWSSGLFMLVYLAAYDRRNVGGNSVLTAMAVGATEASLILASGLNSGCAINPSKDFCGRITSYFLGYGSAFDSAFILVPLLVPFMGMASGGLMYFASIGWFWPPEPKPKQEMEDEMLLEFEEDIGELRALVIPDEDESEEEEAHRNSSELLDVTDGTKIERKLSEWF